MLQALLKGKLSREEENMEDLLTSNVFGAMKYLPYANGISLLLKKATDENENILELEPIAKVEYSFWPSISEKDCIECEPDVLLKIIHITNNSTTILVESKYRSWLSSEATKDSFCNSQLAREYENLKKIALRDGSNRALLFVTADFSYPHDEIEYCTKEFKEKNPTDPKMKVFWLSWRHVHLILSDQEKSLNNGYKELVGDLLNVLEKQGLIFFKGFNEVTYKAITWKFTFKFWENSPKNHPKKILWHFNKNEVAR